MLARDFAEFISNARHAGHEWQGLCPAHDDSDPSLTWADGDKGLVVTCHGHCPTQNVVAAVGVSMADLFEPGGPGPSRAGGGNYTQQLKATYDYRDADGAVLYQVRRYEPKAFRQYRPNPAGPGTWL